MVDELEEYRRAEDIFKEIMFIYSELGKRLDELNRMMAKK